jgi:exodeoxyribonuclease V alpha subunit
MVSLSLMARLVEALRPQARLVLVGDPGQLSSIEAGAVLGDIVGPAALGPVPEPAPPLAGGIVVLDRVYRFRGAIAELADAIRLGRSDEAMAVLRAGHEEVVWIETSGDEAPAAVREGVVSTARAVTEAARAGRSREALDALGAFRVLCAHRRGAHGVSTWTARIESWIGAAVEGFGAEGRWYVGRPLLVTENDYELQLYNGDTGVVVARGADRVTAAFERRNEIVELSTARLGAVDTVYAMTVHKSQGSQFQTAAVLLPEPSSQILTRELLYTAVTRARQRLILVGTEAAVRAAVQRPVGRASGLRERLWTA